MNSEPIDWTSAAAIVGMAVVLAVWCSVCTLLVWAARREADEIRSQRDFVAMRADRMGGEIKVLKASVLQAQADGTRRTERWRIAHHELYQWALQEGLLANWKRDLPRDTDFSDLSDTIPGTPSANATS